MNERKLKTVAKAFAASTAYHATFLCEGLSEDEINFVQQELKKVALKIHPDIYNDVDSIVVDIAPW